MAGGPTPDGGYAYVCTRDELANNPTPQAPFRVVSYPRQQHCCQFPSRRQRRKMKLTRGSRIQCTTCGKTYELRASDFWGLAWKRVYDLTDDSD